MLLDPEEQTEFEQMMEDADDRVPTWNHLLNGDELPYHSDEPYWPYEAYSIPETSRFCVGDKVRTKFGHRGVIHRVGADLLGPVYRVIFQNLAYEGGPDHYYADIDERMIWDT